MRKRTGGYIRISLLFFYNLYDMKKGGYIYIIIFNIENHIFLVIFSYLINKLGMNFDAPSPWGIYFQDSATPLPEGSGKSLRGSKLPNSGNLLKLLVLSHIWKYMSGWTNYSGIVTSQEMTLRSPLIKVVSWAGLLRGPVERKMDNRGSKSNISENIFVKVQRVDGNCIISRNIMLRYTLMGFERSYRNKIPTTLLVNNIKYYSTSSIKAQALAC